MMILGSNILDPALARKFEITCSNDPVEFTARSCISARLPGNSQYYNYQLRDRELWRMRFNEPIFSLADRTAGMIGVCFAENRFSTEVTLNGDESGVFVIAIPRKGTLTLLQDGAVTTVNEGSGLVLRPNSRARVLFSDAGVRDNLSFKVSEIEAALRHALDADLRRPLEFMPGLDWTCGLAASFKRQLDTVLAEFQSPDGVADNPVALAATTDLLVTLLLRAAPHSYTDQLNIGAPCPVPAYVRRGEEFMRANSAKPICIAEVAAAAGCSVRNLNVVFRRFRNTTPLAALHAIRLDAVRIALQDGDIGTSAATIARRHGFTNQARFATAYRRRFGEAPSAPAHRTEHFRTPASDDRT